MRRSASSAVLLLVSIVLAVVVVAAASGANSTPRVLPVGAKPYGKTYSEWSAAWWQYVFSIPLATNPLLDTTGENCGVGQAGPVFFLVGATSTTTVNRACAVPAGKALFLPILNNECDNVPDFNFTVEQLRGFCGAAMDAATNLSVTVDGQPITGLGSYRAQSPVFSVTVPADNLFALFGFSVPAGTYSPVVGDGYYVMLAPLSSGQHTLSFSGTAGSFSLNVTYQLTVGS